MRRKRFYARLLPLLLPACALDTPVAENSAGSDDRLGEDLGPWCESTCQKLADCGLNLRDDCPEECLADFTSSFVGKGEVCTAAALGLMVCIDTVSCPYLAAGVCDSQEARDRCSAAQRQVSCDSHGMGDSSSGGTGGVGGISLTCSSFYDECTDGRFYAAECEGTGTLECSCTIDGISSGRFRFDGGSCPESSEAREICAWPIVPWPGEPSARPVICNGHVIIGSVGGCQVDFGECSNEVTYGIICDGATNMCTCLVDGEPYGDFFASDSVCPYVLDPDDGGTAAVNAACGFSIAFPSGTE